MPVNSVDKQSLIHFAARGEERLSDASKDNQAMGRLEAFFPKHFAVS